MAVRTYPMAGPVLRLGTQPKVTTRAHHTRFTALAGPGFEGVQMMKPLELKAA